MRRKRNSPGRRPGGKNEQGIIITLVAVFLLAVVGAMAALSIDVVTLYTARGEAQLAADGAALAGARVLANSGLTSTNGTPTPISAEPRAIAVAKQVAMNNDVGGRKLLAREVTVGFNDSASTFATDPHVTVTVQRTDLPTFFARIWGTAQVTVTASATAEAFNPTPVVGVTVPTPVPAVAPICVKPWLLPNRDPNVAGPIFEATTGAIIDPTLVGWTPPTAAQQLQPRCTSCTGALPRPTPWHYYPGDPADFPPPTQGLPACTPALTTGYEESVAGCVQMAIACNGTVNIDTTAHATRNAETANAVNCLTHATSTLDDADQIDPMASAPPFEFLAGAGSPIAIANPALLEQDVTVSDSLVTVPVFDSTTGVRPTNPVAIIGFVQLFLNPDGAATTNGGFVNMKVINLVGCGTAGATGQAILGNGASPVAVRLISQ